MPISKTSFEHRPRLSKAWSEIPAIICDGDEAQQRLWEIAENLHRAELTVQERANHIAEWVRLTGDASGATCATKPGAGQGSKGGIRAAVRELGIDRTEAQRSVKIASVPDEVKKAAREAGIDDNQAALLRVASETSAERQLARIRDEQQKAEAHKANREAYRVDQDRVARVSFNPRDRSTWGQGGKAPLLVEPCTDGPTRTRPHLRENQG